MIGESVVSELTEQICQESFGCCPREDPRRTAGESSDPLRPVQSHQHEKVCRLLASDHYRQKALT